jgi:ABC-type sulfate transport system permease component
LHGLTVTRGLLLLFLLLLLRLRLTDLTEQTANLADEARELRRLQEAEELVEAGQETAAACSLLAAIVLLLGLGLLRLLLARARTAGHRRQ